MGTGDYICVTLRGGAPWGFSLREGDGDIYLPLLASQVEDGCHACLAGVQEGDEVVSINGEPCVNLTLSQALALIESSINSLQLLLKRCNSVPSEDYESEGTSLGERVSSDENLKSTTLHIISPKCEIPREVCISDPQGKVLHREFDRGTEPPHRGNLSDEFGGQELVFKNSNKDIRRCFSPGEFVELQVSLSEKTLDNGCCTSLGSARGIEGDFSAIDTVHTTSSHHVPCPVREPLGQHGVVVSAPSVEVSLQPQYASGTGRGTLSVGGTTVIENVGSQSEEQEEGGLCQPVPASFTVSFEIPSDEATLAEEQEDYDSEGDQEKPNKHRARHARLRRNESLSEKQVKEAKSKCKRIALLLSAAPSNPHNKGVLMFKKHRQRAKKYTLVSYGTGEDEPDFSDEEDEVNEDSKQEIPAGEFSFEATIDCDSQKPFLLNAPGIKGVLTFKLGKTLVEINNKLNNQAEMECLPETKGKGAAMFAQRRQRMDEITAEHEELRRQGLPVEAVQELGKKVVEQSYMQSTRQGHAYMDVNMHQQSQQQYQQYQEQQYYEQQQNYQQQQQYQQYQHQQYEQYQQQQVYQQQQQYHQEQQQMHQYSTNINGTAQHQTNEIQSSYSNRTAKPFTAENNVATCYSHGGSGTNQDSVGQGEQIASRDERISTPAIRTGLLSDSRRKNTGKPMFTFKEAPKVSPNPALLNLLNRSDKKGFESGPEEDYLSLGAEACNFLQSQRLKTKIPPPVAPKPVINPNSPPWSAQIEPSNQDMPQCAENSLSTPAAAPTTETVSAPELEPTPAPAPEASSLTNAEETTANPTTAEQHSWTLPEPESQQQPTQVTPQEANSQLISAKHSETSKMTTWGSVQLQAHQQSAACSWQSAQVQPQNPPPSQSPTQPPWVTRQPTQSQTQIQLNPNSLAPQGTQREEKAQPQTNAQPPWSYPQEQLQSQPQVQPTWTPMQDKPNLQQLQPSWSQVQESALTQPQNQWAQPSHTESQQQLPWVQPQQKSQVQPPWVQQVQPELQPQPPWVQQIQPETHPQPTWGQQQHHQALPQSWASPQVPGQPQPPWVSTSTQHQPSGNPWPPSQTQAQSQPLWMNAAQVQPQTQAQVNLNPWAPVPAQNPSQTSWDQQPPEHGAEQHIHSWAQEQNQAQHQPPWDQSVPSQSTWQQSLSNTSQQPQLNTWSSAQPQPPTPVNHWRPQLQQTSLNVPMSTVNTQPSPKPWQPPLNQTPPPPPRRMFSYTVGQKATSPVNPMATVLNPKLSQGSAFEMPVVKGKGADMFAKRQSRMEKFVVDSETVEANKASRSTSPAASLPNEWKYTPNVRAPPPRAYNPIQSPFYPPAATKQPPASSTSTKIKKKHQEKPTPAPKPLNVIDVMKHQPYKLDSALFIFGPGTEAAKPPAPKPTSPLNPLPDNQTIRCEQMSPVQQAGPFSPPYPQQGYRIPIQPVMHDPHYQQAQSNVYPYQPPPGGAYQQEYIQQYLQPAPPPYNPQAPQPLNHPYQQAAYQPASSPPYLATPSVPNKAPPSSTYAAPRFPVATRPESVTGASTGTAPKPKFTANKSSAQATGRSYTLSPPAKFTGQKSASASSSPRPQTRASTNPLLRQISSLNKGFKPLTPWEAASRHPLGLVDEAFAFQDLQESLASNVHLAARHKILPESPDEWKGRVSYPAPQKPASQTWSQSRNQGRPPIPSFISPSRSPASSLRGYRSLPRQWQPQKYLFEANQRPSVSLSERPMYMSAYTSNTWSWRR